jgi:PAS domain S-box-containing protein
MAAPTASLRVEGRHPFTLQNHGVWRLYALISLVFVMAATLLLVNRYQARFQLAEESLNNLVTVNSQNLLLQMRNIESILRSTAVEYQNAEDSDEDALQGFVTIVVNDLPQFRTLLVLDSSGVIIADSRPEAPARGTDVSDRAYFTVHREATTSSPLFVDNPVQSRVDGNWSLPISIGVRDNSDAFVGVIVASLDPIFLSDSLGAFADQNIRGYISKDDGTVLTSLPYTSELVGSTIPYPHLNDLAPPMDEQSYFYNDMLVVHRHVQPYEWEVTFSQPRAVIIGSFLYEAGVTVFTVLVLSLVTYLIFYQQIRQTDLIRQNERELRTVTDNITDNVARFSADLRHLFVNRAVATNTDIPIQQYIGSTNRELGMPDDLVDIWDQGILEVFTTGEPHDMQFRHESTEGPRWYMARLTPETDERGDVQTVLSVVRDITAIKEAQLALEEKTRQLELSLKAAQAGVWVWDLTTNAITWDARMEQIHGLPDGTFGGNYDAWRSGLHPEDIDEVEAAISAAVSTRATFEKEFRIVRSDGTIRNILAQAELVFDEDTGEPLRMVGVNIDVTERKKLERQHLEAERARIEMEEKQKVIEMRERFIATASHDFRTPLTIILTSIGMLEDYDEQFTHAQRLAKIQRVKDQVHYMTEMLDGVLTLSKANSGKIDLSLTRIKLREFCDEIWSNSEILDASAHQKELQVNTTIEEFTADSRLLREVLDNLLDNARKYTPEGKRIACEVRNDDTSITFAVTDQGYGVPPKDLPHLFEPFHRAGNVASIRGTGLGLSIVKDYVELHQGTISVTSEEGEGTTVTVTIPLNLATEDE